MALEVGKSKEDSRSVFMRRAIALAIENVDQKRGGPFGAVIVKDGKIIAESANSVTQTLDPTAHAEVNAIRKACQNLHDFKLEGCEIYTSCEPCPMCLAAIYWARIDRIYFAGTQADAAKIGFDDKFLYDEIPLPLDRRKIPTENFLREDAAKAFSTWENSAEKIPY